MFHGRGRCLWTHEGEGRARRQKDHHRSRKNGVRRHLVKAKQRLLAVSGPGGDVALLLEPGQHEFGDPTAKVEWKVLASILPP